jgi:hypothetical protein
MITEKNAKQIFTSFFTTLALCTPYANNCVRKFYFSQILISSELFYHRLPKRRRRMEYRQGLHLQQL